MLDSSFDHKQRETPLYEAAERQAVFKAGRVDASPFTIMIPPPNVTGSLHVGHALSYTLQDILIRYYRMRGRDCLWQPGTDHAGIATQMMVEKQLAAEGITRQQLGREAFLAKVWEWKQQSGDTITKQLRRLGASADWSRERFTMDEGLSKAVRHAFVRLYNDGLIYKDKRLVNWDCALQTAVSDLEVIPTETKGAYYHIAYPLADGDGQIVVATTRPETLFGDQAVAVHPDDERYQSLIGRRVRLPLTERTIPIIADSYSDPEKGTGAVKITPAHDFNDFEVGRRHSLDLLNILNKDGILNEHAGAFAGQDRLKARAKVVEALEAAGLLIKIEPMQHTVPHGDRSGTVIEPYLTEQWYCKADVLAKPALEAVRSGKSRFIPQQWENTYFHWLENIQPWCISRQLWWGHQIPAWYDDDGTIIYVAETFEQAQAQAGQGRALTQDPDVLDTWFSSGLWPFSTLGWPENTREIQRYYPTDVLVTGFDIIFFWVARMMMFGLYFTGEVPFKDIYIHGLVRDAKGQKMSKTKGNVIDPLTLCDEYGTDAVRFTMAHIAVQGRDARLAPERVALSRNFVTKLWNAAKFCTLNKVLLGQALPDTIQHPFNLWILNKLNQTIEQQTNALEHYQFNEAADTIHGFVWDTFCDWYIEFSKPLLQQDDTETQAVAAYVLGRILHLLHPLMPFVTDELAQKLGGSNQSLTAASWPEALNIAAAPPIVDTVQQIISTLRRERGLLGISNAIKFPVFVDATAKAEMAVYQEQINRMANVTIDEVALLDSIDLPPVNGWKMSIPSALVDKAERLKHFQTEVSKANKDVAFFAGKLNNKNFVEKADPEVVEEHREKLKAAQDMVRFCEQQMQRFQDRKTSS